MGQPRFAPAERERYRQRKDQDDTGMALEANSHSGVHVPATLMRVFTMGSVAVCNIGYCHQCEWHRMLLGKVIVQVNCLALLTEGGYILTRGAQNSVIQFNSIRIHP
jgi:hypothetical protein